MGSPFMNTKLNVQPLCNDREWEQVKAIAFDSDKRRIQVRNIQMEQMLAKVRARKGDK